MKFRHAIGLYFEDMVREGRIRSKNTETLYLQVLEAHADDVQNRDPRTTNRDDVKRTLKRWAHPNTQAARHSVLVSFYDWCEQEAIRETNPARQVRRAKKKPTSVYRMTREEAARMLATAQTTREIRISHLGFCAGARNAELRGLQGRHFKRPGFVHFSEDIAKRNHVRWVPILPELQPVVDEIVRLVPDDHFILPSASAGGWGPHVFAREDPTMPMSSQTLQRTVHRLAKRAGIAAHIHPHLLRHAFADHVARFVGIKQAQSMLGHADIQTTQIYVGEPTLEELARAVEGLRFAPLGVPPSRPGVSAPTEREGFEPSNPGRSATDDDGLEPSSVVAWFSRAGNREFQAKVALYAAHFRGLHA